MRFRIGANHCGRSCRGRNCSRTEGAAKWVCFVKYPLSVLFLGDFSGGDVNAALCSGRCLPRRVWVGPSGNKSPRQLLPRQQLLDWDCSRTKGAAKWVCFVIYSPQPWSLLSGQCNYRSASTGPDSRSHPGLNLESVGSQDTYEVRNRVFSEKTRFLSLHRLCRGLPK